MTNAISYMEIRFTLSQKREKESQREIERQRKESNGRRRLVLGIRQKNKTNRKSGHVKPSREYEPSQRLHAL